MDISFRLENNTWENSLYSSNFYAFPSRIARLTDSNRKPEWRKSASNTGSRGAREEGSEEDGSLLLFLSPLCRSFASLGVLLREVPLHVQREMIASGERALADRAFKGLSPGVLAVMPRQFVAPGESPLALRPLTLIRFLA